MKNIIAVIVVVLVAIGVWLIKPFKTYAPQNTEDKQEEVKPTGQTVGQKPTPKPIEIKQTAQELEMAEKLRNIWNAFIVAATAHDMKTLANLSFRLSYNCQHLDQYQKECFETMDNFVSVAKNIKTEDYKLVWYDEKQAILMTTLKPASYDGNTGYYQPRIFFAFRDGSYHVLSYFPDWGRFANKDKVNQSEIEAFLKKGLLDTDKDGFTDMEENCDDGSGVGSIEGCKKTDPNDRDMNDDGWWDGVEPYLPENALGQ